VTRVELELVHSWIWRWTWSHELDLVQHQLVCVVRNVADAGVLRLGVADAGSLDWDALRSASCFQEEDFIAPSCRTDGASVHARFDGDGGFWFALGVPLAPPVAFERATEQAFQSCQPLFRTWDGGTYPFRF
jgi:hypothetical protein